MLPAILFVMGLMKNGTGAFLMSAWLLESNLESGEKRRTHCDHSEKHEEHQTAFSIVHEVPEPQPLLCLACNLPLLSLLISLWQQRALTSKVIQQVFNDECTFGNDHWFGGAWSRNGQYWRLSERMDLLEFGRRQVCFSISMEDFELIVDFELLEEP